MALADSPPWLLGDTGDGTPREWRQVPAWRATTLALDAAAVWAGSGSRKV
jgi:hypothetical protein